MDRGDILSGDAFAAVLRSAIAFLAVLVLMGWAAVSYMERKLVAELGAEVRAQWDILAADHDAQGPDHVVATIGTLPRLHAPGRAAFAIFDADHRKLAGNVMTRPAGQGLQVGPLDHETPPAAGDASDFVYYSGDLDGRTLVVGQRLDLVSHTRTLILRALAITGFAVILLMLAFGYVLSRESLTRLREIEATLDKAAEGDIAARIPENGGKTQIDRVARQMNQHLDRLSRLMTTTRDTAAAVAHDLKSPLSRAYLGLGRALDRIDAGEDPRAEIEDTQGELGQMRAMFDTYLQLARIESGADGARFHRVDLGPLCDDLADTYRPVAEDAGQSLDYTQDGGGGSEVEGDAGMLLQMIVNLLQNAVTHGGPGNRIELRLDRADGQVRLSVTDSGPGIPPAARDAVFEPFRRLDPSRSRPGSGLGLALVRAIAERHGAAITLGDNDPGLRVEVVFPAP
ncbi:MAG: HAMP domain-containing histidine kinase [Defluviimonas sp.]|uniref:HAMP domain-containing sensor histidine kinase n=1 Tax=Albidovulum sp. TaxID=1872424 RepID=UPI001D62ABFF|nr:HAMP domain-containing histidine kinase [Paracoccaceae bacterium]MCC0065020.1 HAMP domain-containing histidine kinase [Defluviimonas sp.]